MLFSSSHWLLGKWRESLLINNDNDVDRWLELTAVADQSDYNTTK